MVISYDTEKNVFTTSTVKQLVAHTATISPHDFTEYPLMLLSVEHADGAITETKVTANHPYLDPVTAKFKEISLFNIGDSVKTQNGVATIHQTEILIDGTDNQNQQFIDVYDLLMSEGPANYLIDKTVVYA